METTINGIIVNGKVYEVIPVQTMKCHDCDMRDNCRNTIFLSPCSVWNPSGDVVLRYSQSLTDKLNKS